MVSVQQQQLVLAGEVLMVLGRLLVILKGVAWAESDSLWSAGEWSLMMRDLVQMCC